MNSNWQNNHISLQKLISKSQLLKILLFFPSYWLHVSTFNATLFQVQKQKGCVAAFTLFASWHWIDIVIYLKCLGDSRGLFCLRAKECLLYKSLKCHSRTTLPHCCRVKNASIWSVTVSHSSVCLLKSQIVFFSFCLELAECCSSNYNTDIFSVSSDKELSECQRAGHSWP